MFRIPLSILLFLVTACAGTPNTVHPGYTKAQVRAAWGEPHTEDETTMGPDLWIYESGSAGCETYSLIFDEGDRVEEIQHRDNC